MGDCFLCMSLKTTYLLADLTLKGKEFCGLHENERLAYFSKLNKNILSV